MDQLDMKALMILCWETRLFVCSNGHEGVSIRKLQNCPICTRLRESGYMA